jgi:hypothetical protein
MHKKLCLVLLFATAFAAAQDRRKDRLDCSS